MISGLSLKQCRMGSKSRSQAQFKLNACEHTNGYFPIFLKLSQMIFHSSLKLGHMVLKTGHQVKFKKKLVNT